MAHPVPPAWLAARPDAVGAVGRVVAQEAVWDEVEVLYDPSKERIKHQNYRVDLELRKLKASV